MSNEAVEYQECTPRDSLVEDDDENNSPYVVMISEFNVEMDLLSTEMGSIFGEIP